MQSSDLVTWSRQNDALIPIAGTMISTSNIVERPKGSFGDWSNKYNALTQGMVVYKLSSTRL